jgi:hypothetical protein
VCRCSWPTYRQTSGRADELSRRHDEHPLYDVLYVARAERREAAAAGDGVSLFDASALLAGQFEHVCQVR